MSAKITLILDNIRSTYNVGSIFRTAEGFGVEKIILSGYTPYPHIDHDTRLPHIAEKITSQIHKTALGAESLVPFERYETIDSWISQNRLHANLPLIALEQSFNSIPLGSFVAPSEFALLLGEEINGITPILLKNCDTILEIPMKGQKESFNVSVATGVALYALTATT